MSIDDALETRYDALSRQLRWRDRFRGWLEIWLEPATPEDLRDLMDRLERSERRRARPD